MLLVCRRGLVPLPQGFCPYSVRLLLRILFEVRASEPRPALVLSNLVVMDLAEVGSMRYGVGRPVGSSLRGVVDVLCPLGGRPLKASAPCLYVNLLPQ